MLATPDPPRSFTSCRELPCACPGPNTDGVASNCGLDMVVFYD